VGRSYALISKSHHLTFSRSKKTITQSDYSPIHAIVTLLYRAYN